MTDEVQHWLESIGLPQYLNNFLQNGYDDMDSLWDLNHDDLDAIGVTLPGHRKKILHNAAKFSSDVQGDWGTQTSHEEAPPPSQQPVSQPEEGEDLNAAIWNLGTLLGELSEYTDGESADDPPPLANQITRMKSPNPTSPAVRSSVYTTDTLQESTQVGGEDIDLDDLLEDLYSFNPVAELEKIEKNKGKVEKEAPILNYIPPSLSTAKSYPSEDFSDSNLHPRSQTVLSPRKSISMEFPEVNESRQDPLLLDPKSSLPAFMTRSKTLSKPTSDNTDPTRLLATPQHLQPDQVKSRLEELSKDLDMDANLSLAEKDQMLKEEKIKIALEKMKVASKQKIVIKAFNEDMSAKTVVVDDDMQAWYVAQTLIMKNHTSDSPNWGLVEFLPEFSLHRMLEDHEIVIDAYQAWPRDTKNMFIFKNDEYKYDLFHRPYEYFPAELCLSSEQAKSTKDARTDRARKMLINEYFSEQGRIPELEGLLVIKDGKKPWKRLFVLLRGSGIYYSNRGKSKQSKHLVSFCSINDHDIYVADNYRKLYSAPKNYCFVLKPQGRHLNVGLGDLKCFCAPNKRLMYSWLSGIRLVKHGGPQLKENFVSMQNKDFKLAQMERDEPLQDSGSPPHQTPTPNSQLNRRSSAPASAVMEVKTPLTQSLSGTRDHSPSVPTPYTLSPHRLSIISPTEDPKPFIPSQHPGALHLPPPTSQLPIRSPQHTLSQQQTEPNLNIRPPEPAAPILQPPAFQPRPVAPKPSKKPLFIPRSEQDSRYAPNSVQPPMPQQANVSPPHPQQIVHIPTPFVPEKRKKPAPHQNPTLQTSIPVQPVPHQIPSMPVQPVPHQIPSMPVQPVPHQIPSMPVQPVPHQIPSMPVQPVPHQIPSMPVQPVPHQIPSMPVQPVPHQIPSMPVQPVPHQIPSMPVQPVPHQTRTALVQPIQHQIPGLRPIVPIQPIVSPPKPQTAAAHVFQDKSWFHGQISRDEAAHRIFSVGSVDGIYLIRESTTYKGSYVLTMVSHGQLRNFQIQNHGAVSNPLYGIDDGPRFISVDELIQHYSSFDDRLPCKLTQLCIKHNFSTHV